MSSYNMEKVVIVMNDHHDQLIIYIYDQIRL